MNDVALVDTGFWIAMFDPREGKQHTEAIGNADLIEDLTILVPWPLLYETLRTRFVKRKEWMIGLDSRLKGNTKSSFFDFHASLDRYPGSTNLILESWLPSSR